MLLQKIPICLCASTRMPVYTTRVGSDPC